jgi:Domain of unknown function (DUF4136)
MRPGAATTTALVVWLCAVVVLQGAKIKTRAESDPKFSFREVKTWAWDPSETGKVIMARASTDDPAPVKKRVEPVLVAAVARELGLRGLTQASAGQPDLMMHYYVLVTVGMDAQVMGQFLPAVPEWGVPPFAAATQSLDIVTRGSVVLDAVSTSLGRVVWRGVAQTDVDTEQSDAKRDAIIRDAAHELVKRIPLKK